MSAPGSSPGRRDRLVAEQDPHGADVGRPVTVCAICARRRSTASPAPPAAKRLRNPQVRDAVRDHGLLEDHPLGMAVRMPSRRSAAFGPRKSAAPRPQPVGAGRHRSLDGLEPIVAREEHLDLRGRCRGAGGDAHEDGGDGAQDQRAGRTA